MKNGSTRLSMKWLEKFLTKLIFIPYFGNGPVLHIILVYEF